MLYGVVANEESVHFADILPPTFGATCPSSSLVVYAEHGQLSAQVNWTEPAATDNSGILPAVTSNHQSLQRLSQGTHVIRTLRLTNQETRPLVTSRLMS